MLCRMTSFESVGLNMNLRTRKNQRSSTKGLLVRLSILQGFILGIHVALQKPGFVFNREDRRRERTPTHSTPRRDPTPPPWLPGDFLWGTNVLRAHLYPPLGRKEPRDDTLVAWSDSGLGTYSSSCKSSDLQETRAIVGCDLRGGTVYCMPFRFFLRLFASTSHWPPRRPGPQGPRPPASWTMMGSGDRPRGLSRSTQSSVDEKN